MKCTGYTTTETSKVYCPLHKNCSNTKLVGNSLNTPYSFKDKSCKHYLPVGEHEEKYKRVVVSTKTSRYVILVDSENIVVKCVPNQEFFMSKDIMELYEEYKGKAVFELQGEGKEDFLYEENIKPLIDKNPAIQSLIDKFSLTI